MIRNLLLALDFSPSSERALAYSVDLLERTDGSLHLMYVQKVSQGPFGREGRAPMPTYKLQEEFEERSRELLSSHGFDPDDDRLSFKADRADAVAPTLARYAENRDLDVITMGTHGRRGVQRAFYGSVAEETLRTAPTPVFTVRAPDEDEFATSIDRIVAPVDFSDSSWRALQQAGRLASVYEVPLKLVHVVEPPNTPSVYDLGSPKVKSHKAKEKAEEALQEWGSELATEGQEASYVVHRGDPGSCTLRSAPNPTDLIVMSTRGLRGVRRAMLGSVTEEVLREAKGPVLAARNFPDSD